MPGKSIYRKRGRKKVPRRLYRRKLRTNLGKVLDGKINTAVEKRMVEIAKKEAQKGIKKRVLRTYPQGTYTFSDNSFTGLAVNNTGSMTEVARILKADGIGSIDVQGTRLGNQVYITGFQLLIRAALSEQTAGTPFASFEYSNVAYALVGIRDAWEPDSTYSPQPVLMDDVLPWYNWGYTPLIDAELDSMSSKRHMRIFCKGTISFKGNEIKANTSNVKRYIKLNKPLNVDYKKADTSSTQRPLDWKFYLALRSNVPSSAETTMIPNVCTCLKTFYYEPA